MMRTNYFEVQVYGTYGWTTIHDFDTLEEAQKFYLKIKNSVIRRIIETTIIQLDKP